MYIIAIVVPKYRHGKIMSMVSFKIKFLPFLKSFVNDEFSGHALSYVSMMI